MKTLILVRHAQSDKNAPSRKDFDRPLNRRGERDASAMAERFAKIGLRTDALISSPALRACTTAEAFARQLGLPVQTDIRIYEAGIQELQETVRSLDDRLGTVVLVGHNPGLSNFLRYLTDENYADLPTTGIATIVLPLKSWRHTVAGKGLLKASMTPKDEPFGIQTGGPVLNRQERYRIWRFEHARQIYLSTIFIVALFIILGLVGLVMYAGFDLSGRPQQDSSSR
jgi:phosphohistidine phosphatase